MGFFVFLICSHFFFYQLSSECNLQDYWVFPILRDLEVILQHIPQTIRLQGIVFSLKSKYKMTQVLLIYNDKSFIINLFYYIKNFSLDKAHF